MLESHLKEGKQNHTSDTPLVYGQSNSLFFGDNSSRGQAVTALGAINLSPVPEPAAAMLLVAGLCLLATRRKRC